MDEPFSALDELTREQLRLELLRLFDAQRQTVLFVTHSIAEAVHLADEVVVLSSSPGRVIGEVTVPLVRPRAALVETTMAFHEIENEVRLGRRCAVAGCVDAVGRESSRRGCVPASRRCVRSRRASIWQLVALHTQSIIPPLGSIISALTANPHLLFDDGVDTLQESLVGLAAGFALGVPRGGRDE